MVSEDDARYTLEYEDSYVIQPAFHKWDAAAYMNCNGGKLCPEGFKYGSDTNSQWLTVEQLQKMVASLGKASGG